MEQVLFFPLDLLDGLTSCHEVLAFLMPDCIEAELGKLKFILTQEIDSLLDPVRPKLLLCEFLRVNSHFQQSCY